MSIIIASTLSILENPYQTEKVKEKYNPEYVGFSVFLKVEEIDGVPFYNSILELGVGAESWIFDEEQPVQYSKVYGEHLRNACYLKLVSPIYRNSFGKSNVIELCNTPEKSILKIVCKGWSYKTNKRSGQYQKSKEGQFFIKGKQCLCVEAWLVSEVAAAAEPAPELNTVPNTVPNTEPLLPTPAAEPAAAKPESCLLEAPAPYDLKLQENQFKVTGESAKK